MTKSKKTKRALLFSVLSMMLCVAMLTGSTFAWFSDTATSQTNRIVAGNLDVELYYRNDYTMGLDEPAADEDGWAKATDKTARLFVDVNGELIEKWEPGVMALTEFKVVNKGTVALKYSLKSTAEKVNWTWYTGKDGIRASHSLKEAIKFAVTSDRPLYKEDLYEGMVCSFKSRKEVLDLNLTYGEFGPIKAEATLAPGDATTFIVVAYWKPGEGDTDNQFNVKNGQKTYVSYEEGAAEDKTNPKLYIEIGVQIDATQASYEKDGFDEKYDASEALTVGGTIKDDFEGELVVPVG